PGSRRNSVPRGRPSPTIRRSRPSCVSSLAARAEAARSIFRALQKAVRESELPCHYFLENGGRRPPPAALGAPFRQEIAQHDGAPAQREERQQRRCPFGMRRSEVREERVLVEVALRLGQAHAGMQHEVADAGERIVPAEVFEIEKRYLPVRAAQRVVRAEI